MLHLEIGKGDIVADVGEFEDVGVLIAGLPLHILRGDGGLHFLAADADTDGVWPLLIGNVGEGRHVIPFAIERGVFDDMEGVGSVLIGDGEKEESRGGILCGCHRETGGRGGGESGQGISGRDGAAQRGVGG